MKMSLLHALFLGAVQGVTEFLPISSDGHLIVAAWLFPTALQGRDALGFDVLLHCGSLLALLLLYASVWLRLISAPFRGDRTGMRLLFLLILSAVPGAIVGLLLEDIVALRLRTLAAAALGFLCTAVALLLAERVGERRQHEGHRDSLGIGRALLLGSAQAIAILPGVSRSGMTIAMGRLIGLSRREAVDVSFLMAVPIIGGAVAKIFLDAWQGSVIFPPLPIAVAGFTSSFLVSAAAIVLLRAFIRARSTAWFALYLVPLGAILLYQVVGMHFLDVSLVMPILHRYGPIILFGLGILEVIPPFSVISPVIFLLIAVGSFVPSPEAALFYVLAPACGMVVGNMALYRIGWHCGHPMAHRLRIGEARLRSIEEIFRRWGILSIFFAQFIGLIRPAVALIAGAARMHPQRYYPPMVISSVAWAFFYVAAGFVLRDHVHSIFSALGVVGALLYLGAFVGIALELWITGRKKGN